MSNMPLISETKPKKGTFHGRRGNPQNCQKCGAKTRRGTPCKLPAERNPFTGKRTRCRRHGGHSSGPRTEAGKARVAAAAFRHGRFTKAAMAAKNALQKKLTALRSKTPGVK